MSYYQKNYLCNIPLHCVNIYLLDWFNKEVDWPIAEQDKVRWENQTEDDGEKNGRGRRVARDMDMPY